MNTFASSQTSCMQMGGDPLRTSSINLQSPPINNSKVSKLIITDTKFIHKPGTNKYDKLERSDTEFGS